MLGRLEFGSGRRVEKVEGPVTVRPERLKRRVAPAG
jgi:hypothetical protein